MEEKTLKIGGGKPEAFLVCDKSLADCKAPFFNWLQGEDFTMEYMEQQLDLTEILLQPLQAEIVRQLLL